MFGTFSSKKWKIFTAHVTLVLTSFYIFIFTLCQVLSCSLPGAKLLYELASPSVLQSFSQSRVWPSLHIEGLHSFSCLSVLLTVYLFVWLYLFYFFPFLNFSISVFICYTFSLFSITSLLWTGCPCFTRIFMKVIYMNFLSCTWTKPTLSICTVLYNFSLALNIWFKQFWMSRREASLEFRSGEFVKIEFVSRADYLKTF